MPSTNYKKQAWLLLREHTGHGKDGQVSNKYQNDCKTTNETNTRQGREMTLREFDVNRDREEYVSKQIPKDVYKGWRIGIF